MRHFLKTLSNHKTLSQSLGIFLLLLSMSLPHLSQAQTTPSESPASESSPENATPAPATTEATTTEPAQTPTPPETLTPPTEAQAVPPTASEVAPPPTSAAPTTQPLTTTSGALAPAVTTPTSENKLPADKLAILNIESLELPVATLNKLSELLFADVANFKEYSLLTPPELNTLAPDSPNKLSNCHGQIPCLQDLSKSLPIKSILLSTIDKIGNSYIINLKLLNLASGETEKRSYTTTTIDENELINNIHIAVDKLFNGEITPPEATAATAKTPAPVEPEKPVTPEGTLKKEPKTHGSIGAMPIFLWFTGGFTTYATIRLISEQSHIPKSDSTTSSQYKKAAVLSGVCSIAAIGGGVLLAIYNLTHGSSPDSQAALPGKSLVPLLGADSVGLAFSQRF